MSAALSKPQVTQNAGSILITKRGKGLKPLPDKSITI
jgi:hypothetical protein